MNFSIDIMFLPTLNIYWKTLSDVHDMIIGNIFICYPITYTSYNILQKISGISTKTNLKISSRSCLTISLISSLCHSCCENCFCHTLTRFLFWHFTWIHLINIYLTGGLSFDVLVYNFALRFSVLILPLWW